jgi:hypothetical protein
MATLRNIHQLMNERRMVQLADGRIGKVVRVDTTFPDNATVVTVWTNTDEAYGPVSTSGPASGPGISKVSLADIVGQLEDTQRSA